MRISHPPYNGKNHLLVFSSHSTSPFARRRFPFLRNQYSPPCNSDAASVRLPKCSTAVKALRFAPTSAPLLPYPASCAALTRRALLPRSPHRRGRGRGAAADGRQARHTVGGGLTVSSGEGRGDRFGGSSRAGLLASPYDSSCLLLVRRTFLIGITLVSPWRCASNSRGVGPAGVGTSARFSMS